VFWDAGYRAYFADGYLEDSASGAAPLDAAAVLANAHVADLAQQKYDFLFVSPDPD
jgi:hypothetical protein